MSHYDLAIIGSGSGNSVVSDEMSGWKIALIEEMTFGGTCLNVGCIPTKMFVYTADVADSIHDSVRFGIDSSLDGVRWSDIRNRIFGRIDPISAGGRMYREESDNVTLYAAHARFDGERSLRLDTGEQITADRIVIATGSRASVPPVVTDSGIDYYTSDTIMRIAELPRRLAILGGGYIAAEFAHIFSALGVEVTIVTRGPALLAQLDEEIRDRFTTLAQGRWDVRLNADVRSIRPEPGGLALDLGADPDTDTVHADMLLVATGRIPNADLLDLELGGVEVGDGRIVVDEYQRTTAAGVWALGDVSSPQQLKHVANQDSRIVVHNLTHPDDLQPSNHTAIPAAVFTEPQIASVGLSEQAARAGNVDVVTAVQDYSSTAYGWAMQDTTSVCKLLADPATKKLLGAHLMGPQASVLIQPLIQAMVFGQTVPELARAQYWIHPALTEVVENALLKLDL